MDNNKLINQFIANLDKKGLDSSLLESDLFDFNQKFVLYNAISSGANLDVLANPDIDAYEMEDILDEQRAMMKEMRNNHGINPEYYNMSQLLELNDALAHDLDISQYKNHEYTANHMYIAKTFQIENLKGIEQVLPNMQMHELINLRDYARQINIKFVEENNMKKNEEKKVSQIKIMKNITIDGNNINYPNQYGVYTTRCLGYDSEYVSDYINALISQYSECIDQINTYDYPEIKLSIQEDKIEEFINHWSRGFEDFLIDKFYNVYVSEDIREISTDNTFLHISENLKNIQEIIKYNPSIINAQNINGHTPLHWSKNPEKTSLLLQNGADINILNTWGASALHTSENVDVTKILIVAGASVNLQDSLGNTPLHYLHGGVLEQYDCWNNFRNFDNNYKNETSKVLITEIELAKELISAGADITIKNSKGESAKVLLEPEIQEYLFYKKKDEDISSEFNLNKDVIEFFNEINPKLVEQVLNKNEICFSMKGMILYGEHAQENPKLLFELFASNCGFKATNIQSNHVISSQKQLQCQQM